MDFQQFLVPKTTFPKYLVTTSSFVQLSMAIIMVKKCPPVSCTLISLSSRESQYLVWHRPNLYQHYDLPGVWVLDAGYNGRQDLSSLSSPIVECSHKTPFPTRPHLLYAPLWICPLTPVLHIIVSSHLLSAMPPCGRLIHTLRFHVTMTR